MGFVVGRKFLLGRMISAGSHGTVYLGMAHADCILPVVMDAGDTLLMAMLEALLCNEHLASFQAPPCTNTAVKRKWQ
eukprot:1496032-Rhodomonas_salina.1